MNRWSAVAVVVAFTCSSFALTPTATATGPSAPTDDARAKAEARTHFERGVRLGETGAYREASVEFERAYRLAPHHAVLFNLGQTYVALGQPVEAADVLQRYLTEGGANVQAARRSEVQAIIKEQQSRISSVTIDANVDGAVLLVDGVAVGRSPLPAPLRVARGEHQVTAVMDGYRATPRTISLAGDDKVRVTMVLERESAPSDVVAGTNPPPVVPNAPAQPLRAAAASPPSTIATDTRAQLAPSLLTQTPGTEPPPDTQSRARRMTGYIVGAVGLAMGGAALAHYFWNKDRFESYEKAMVKDDAKAESIRSASTVTVGLAVGAGALLGTGIVLVTW